MPSKFKQGNLLNILLNSIALIAFIFLFIWSLQNENLTVLAGTLVFTIMILFSLAMTRFSLFTEDSGWSANTLSFTLGFIIYALVASSGSTQSVFAVSFSSILNSVASELPQQFEFFMTTFAAPIAEETLWMYGIPSFVLWTSTLVANRTGLAFLKSKISKVFLLLLVGVITFVLFHVGRSGVITFIIAAAFFRALLLILAEGEKFFNIIPAVDIVPAFGYGAHIANNWVSEQTFTQGLQLLLSSTVGVFIAVFFGIVLVSGVIAIARQSKEIWVNVNG